jgi:hypothetical protein
LDSELELSRRRAYAAPQASDVDAVEKTPELEAVRRAFLAWGTAIKVAGFFACLWAVLIGVGFVLYNLFLVELRDTEPEWIIVEMVVEISAVITGWMGYRLLQLRPVGRVTATARRCCSCGSGSPPSFSSAGQHFFRGSFLPSWSISFSGALARPWFSAPGTERSSYRARPT